MNTVSKMGVFLIKNAFNFVSVSESRGIVIIDVKHLVKGSTIEQINIFAKISVILFIFKNCFSVLKFVFKFDSNRKGTAFCYLKLLQKTYYGSNS